MRDVLLSLVLVGMMPVSVMRPFIGALMFAIISLANPHRLTWSFAYSLPWAMSFAILTISGLLLTRDRLVGDSLRRYSLVLIYLLWTVITTAFALVPDSALIQLERVAKIHVMCLVTLCLLTDWKKCKQLVWVTVCCIAFYGLKGGIFTILNGGHFIVWGPRSSAIEDNNELAAALVMIVPLMYWLYIQCQRWWLRLAIAFSALMSAASVFGSHSRGALLAVIAMSTFLLVKTRHKIIVAILLIACGGGLVAFMPQAYWDRMATIETYQQDASAMGRINTWKTAINIANQRVTGGGFNYYNRATFERYAPNPDAVHSSHSIYFQALGEHGWIGFVIFISILAYVWMQCRHIIRHARDTDDGRSKWLLARMIQVSMIGLCVGGAFVNIGNWDMVYYLAITAMAVARNVDVQVAQHKYGAKTAPRASSATYPTADTVGRPAG
jgi:probable O-glycosylation ligase (exosortase A-associated)